MTRAYYSKNVLLYHELSDYLLPRLFCTVIVIAELSLTLG
ncbi:hypothetical protein GPLA_0412 [Paraglaciecola polaris LMG 21857]|uniref:Uncharacterized protein n=1 Tax=Paraglaciecola polaris LMG 21857 TaxID=1129793 RepID=K7A7C0_9ALTE|nr:hypothetical protein GPLA_0412 [Paraglaciecola polaris LMG 21857]